MEQMRYKAFISYRHQSPDQDIAKKLHTQIETYGIPASLKKSLGISKMGRVFRDQEELPLSSDLGDDIHQALDDSEWLICICSPRYLESKWCLEELRYFLSLGRRDHVLTILTEGEPADSFPGELRFREENGVKVEIEPLAADVRAESLEEALKKLNSEKLRILAPMLGVNYDDLKQRARQRRNRILAASAAAVIAVLAGFLGYAVIKNNEITAERNSALISQSKFLANEADELLESGSDRMLALLLAKEALPEDFEKPDRPVTDEAVCVLRSALVSGVSDRYEPVTDFEFPVTAFQANGNSLAVCSDGVPGYLSAYSLENGEEKEYPYSLSKSPYQAAFSKDLLSIYYVDSSGIGHIHQFGSKIMQESVVEYTYFKPYDYALAVDPKCDKYVYTQGYTVYTSLGVQEEESIPISQPVYFPADVFQNNLQYSSMYLTQILAPGTGDVTLMEMREGTFTDAVLYYYFVENVNGEDDYVYGSPDYEDFVIDYAPSFDGNHIVALTYGGVYVWNTFTQQQVAAVSLKAFDGSRLDEMVVSSAGPQVAVTTDSKNLFLYDFSTGSATAVKLGGFLADRMHFSADGSALLCCDTSRNAALVIRSGEIEQKITAEFSLTDACYACHDIYGNSTDDRYLLLLGEKSTRLMKAGGSGSGGMIFRIGGAVMKPDEAVLSADGSKLWYYTGTVQSNGHDEKYCLNVLDLETEENTEVDEFERLDLMFCSHLHRIGDRYIARSGYEGYSKPSRIVVYDAGSFERVMELSPAGTGISETGEPIEAGGMELSFDYEWGQYVIFAGETNYYVFDALTMEELFADVREYYWTNDYAFTDDYLLVHSVRNALHRAQVVNLESWETEGYEVNFGCDTFCGILTHAQLPGLSDQLAVYLYGTKTHVLDLRTGEDVVLELDGSDKAALTEEGIVIRTAGSGCYLYDGIDLAPCEEPEGLFDDTVREFRFLEDWACQDGGVIRRSEDGEPLLDLKDGDAVVTGGCDNGIRLVLNRGDGGIYVLRCLDGPEMLDMAREVLGERQLTQEQRERFFLE